MLSKIRKAVEHDKYFLMDDGSGKPFKVAKSGISDAMCDRIRRMYCGGTVKMAEGGEVEAADTAVEADDQDVEQLLGTFATDDSATPNVPAPALTPAAADEADQVDMDQFSTDATTSRALPENLLAARGGGFLAETPAAMEEAGFSEQPVEPTTAPAAPLTPPAAEVVTPVVVAPTIAPAATPVAPVAAPVPPVAPAPAPAVPPVVAPAPAVAVTPPAAPAAPKLAAAPTPTAPVSQEQQFALQQQQKAEAEAAKLTQRLTELGTESPALGAVVDQISRIVAAPGETPEQAAAKIQSLQQSVRDAERAKRAAVAEAVQEEIQAYDFVANQASILADHAQEVADAQRQLEATRASVASSPTVAKNVGMELFGQDLSHQIVTMLGLAIGAVSSGYAGDPAAMFRTVMAMRDQEMNRRIEVASQEKSLRAQQLRDAGLSLKQAQQIMKADMANLKAGLAMSMDRSRLTARQTAALDSYITQESNRARILYSTTLAQVNTANLRQAAQTERNVMAERRLNISELNELRLISEDYAKTLSDLARRGVKGLQNLTLEKYIENKGEAFVRRYNELKTKEQAPAAPAASVAPAVPATPAAVSLAAAVPQLINLPLTASIGLPTESVRPQLYPPEEPVELPQLGELPLVAGMEEYYGSIPAKAPKAGRAAKPVAVKEKLKPAKEYDPNVPYTDENPKKVGTPFKWMVRPKSVENKNPVELLNKGYRITADEYAASSEAIKEAYGGTGMVIRPGSAIDPSTNQTVVYYKLYPSIKSFEDAVRLKAELKNMELQLKTLSQYFPTKVKDATDPSGYSFADAASKRQYVTEALFGSQLNQILNDMRATYGKLNSLGAWDAGLQKLTEGIIPAVQPILAPRNQSQMQREYDQFNQLVKMFYKKGQTKLNELSAPRANDYQ